MKYDIAVVGGGMSGVSAAVSAVHASTPSKDPSNAYVKLFADRDKVRLDDYATLPLRCLKAAKTKNLLLAGRCVSASREVLGQIRIMGYCFMMGEAAGLTAALASEGSLDTLSIEAKDVQSALQSCGIPTV